MPQLCRRALHMSTLPLAQSQHSIPPSMVAPNDRNQRCALLAQPQTLEQPAQPPRTDKEEGDQTTDRARQGHSSVARRCARRPQQPGHAGGTCRRAKGSVAPSRAVASSCSIHVKSSDFRTNSMCLAKASSLCFAIVAMRLDSCRNTSRDAISLGFAPNAPSIQPLVLCKTARISFLKLSRRNRI